MTFCLALSWGTQARLSVWVFLGEHRHAFLFGFFLGNTGMPFCLGTFPGKHAHLSVWVCLGKHRHAFLFGSFLGNVACLSVWGHFLENTGTPFCKCLSWETQACLSICGKFRGKTQVWPGISNHSKRFAQNREVHKKNQQERQILMPFTLKLHTPQVNTVSISLSSF